jgi:putative transposase
MSRPQRTTTSGTFLVTAITHNRRRLFQVDTTAGLFLETLQRYRTQGLYKLHAFVIMPDHIHLLLTTEDLPKAMKHIRGGFSHSLGSKQEIWQPGYTDRKILNEKDHLDTRDYILRNPVRAHLVANPEDFPYSSAFRGPKSL